MIVGLASGYVMKGVTLFLCERGGMPEGNDGSTTIDNLNVDHWMTGYEQFYYNDDYLWVFGSFANGIVTGSFLWSMHPTYEMVTGS